MIWLVGEFEARSGPHQWDYEKEIGGQRRKIGALKALSEFSRKPMTVEEVRQYIREVVRPSEPTTLEIMEPAYQIELARQARQEMAAMGVSDESIDEAFGTTKTDTCPHDGGTCHHKCDAEYEGKCYRLKGGMVLSKPAKGIDPKVLLALCALRDDLKEIGAGGWYGRVVEIIRLMTGRE